jgi:threonine dehydratase
VENNFLLSAIQKNKCLPYPSFMTTNTPYLPASIDVAAAAHRLREVVRQTPLQYSHSLSRRFQCHVYLKREDLQVVRSYKLRGAYNMISQLPEHQRQAGLVCASAGNHAQGFAWSCRQLNVKGVVFMPVITPKQKVTQVRMHGEGNITIQLVGDNFDDCSKAAQEFTQSHNMTFIPPFDDLRIIEGQATVGKEIADELSGIDYVFFPVGGGGLVAGAGAYLKGISPATKIIGLEPEGAPSMRDALLAGAPVTLSQIDRFVDGAAVKRVGDLTFGIAKNVIDQMHLIPEGKVCSTILRLYNEEAIVVEPAGALSVAALDDFSGSIKYKKVVCIISGSNNDIDRMPEIKERSLQYEGLKHYFLIRFAQRPGALKEFVNNVLGPYDDITRFEYMQKTNKESGPALVGIELEAKRDYASLLEKMQENHIDFTEINKDDKLYGYLI